MQTLQPIQNVLNQDSTTTTTSNLRMSFCTSEAGLPHPPSCLLSLQISTVLIMPCNCKYLKQGYCCEAGEGAQTCFNDEDLRRLTDVAPLLNVNEALWTSWLSRPEVNAVSQSWVTSPCRSDQSEHRETVLEGLTELMVKTSWGLLKDDRTFGGLPVWSLLKWIELLRRMILNLSMLACMQLLANISWGLDLNLQIKAFLHESNVLRMFTKIKSDGLCLRKLSLFCLMLANRVLNTQDSS